VDQIVVVNKHIYIYTLVKKNNNKKHTDLSFGRGMVMDNEVSPSYSNPPSTKSHDQC
jgi:hypothetical protein